MFFVLVILKFWRKKDLALYNGDNFSTDTNHYSRYFVVTSLTTCILFCHEEGFVQVFGPAEITRYTSIENEYFKY